MLGKEKDLTITVVSGCCTGAFVGHYVERGTARGWEGY